MERTAADHARIRVLNDAMRGAGPGGGSTDRWVLTSGVVALGRCRVHAAVEAVRSFDLFNRENDPYGEHDFGSFNVDREQVLWKIDCYNLTLDGGSPDPGDSAVTVRVLTIMLASEY